MGRPLNSSWRVIEGGRIFLVVILLSYPAFAWFWPPLIQVTRVTLRDSRGKVVKVVDDRGKVVKVVLRERLGHVRHGAVQAVETRLDVPLLLAELSLVVWASTRVGLLLSRRAPVGSASPSTGIDGDLRRREPVP